MNDDRRMFGQSPISRYAAPLSMGQDVGGEGRDERPGTQERGVQAQEIYNDALRPHIRDYRIENNLGAAGPNKDRRREGRSNQLDDNPKTIAAEHATPKPARGRGPQSHAVVDKSGRKELQPGCLHLLGLNIMGFLSGRSRKRDPGARKRGSDRRNMQHASEGQGLERATNPSEVSSAHPQQGEYPPQRSSRVRRGDAQTTRVPAPHPSTPADQSRASASSSTDSPTPLPQSLHAADLSGAPAIFPGAHTGYISGGTYYFANTVIIQHNYPPYPPSVPAAAHSYPS